MIPRLDQLVVLVTPSIMDDGPLVVWYHDEDRARRRTAPAMSASRARVTLDLDLTRYDDAERLAELARLGWDTRTRILAGESVDDLATHRRVGNRRDVERIAAPGGDR